MKERAVRPSLTCHPPHLPGPASSAPLPVMGTDRDAWRVGDPRRGGGTERGEITARAPIQCLFCTMRCGWWAVAAAAVRVPATSHLQRAAARSRAHALLGRDRCPRLLQYTCYSPAHAVGARSCCVRGVWGGGLAERGGNVRTFQCGAMRRQPTRRDTRRRAAASRLLVALRGYIASSFRQDGDRWTSALSHADARKRGRRERVPLA